MLLNVYWVSNYFLIKSSHVLAVTSSNGHMGKLNLIKKSKTHYQPEIRFHTQPPLTAELGSSAVSKGMGEILRYLPSHTISSQSSSPNSKKHPFVLRFSILLCFLLLL